jgi:hypothetical protein
MNKAAIGNWQLTIGCGFVAEFWPLSSRIASFSPIAYRLLPIAFLPLANSFTVTLPRTSVTHRGLAGSVLISVGKVAFGQERRGQSRAEQVVGRGLRCSFQGGACIK